jgi:hypothetical protein
MRARQGALDQDPVGAPWCIVLLRPGSRGHSMPGVRAACPYLFCGPFEPCSGPVHDDTSVGLRGWRIQ